MVVALSVAALSRTQAQLPVLKNSQMTAAARGAPRVIPVAAPGAACPADPAESPWKLLCRSQPPHPEFTSTGPSASPNPPWSCDIPQSTMTFLIASVPDPETTHLSLYFDRTVESLMRAIAEAGYGFEGYWLPWAVDSKREFSLLADRDCSARAQQRRQTFPGLLLFRGPSGGPGLALFLVGEAPTSGINTTQLEATVGAIAAAYPGGQIVPINMVGPNFSGSLRPLAAELSRKKWLENSRFQFHWVSGAATSYREISDFEEFLHEKPMHRYETVLENDKTAADLFFGYAKEMWSGSFRVGVLSEDETEYSASMDRPESMEPHDWLSLVYPREISRLRNAYQVERVPTASHDNPGPSQPSLALFSLRDAVVETQIVERDSVPAFSGLQSPASQQATLTAISAALRRERVDYVGIVATDVLDSLFLSHHLREWVPDTRLFTLDADLLFAAPGDALPLDGMLSITTYPLVSRNQHWTATSGSESSGALRRIEFSSRYAEGTYNACRRLVKYAKSSDIPTAANDGLIEYSPPGQISTHPPLWLTVLGRDGYWPVALLDNENAPKDSKLLTTAGPAASQSGEEGRPIHPEPPGRGWFILFWTILVAATFHCWFVFFLLRGPNEKLSGLMSTLRDKFFWAYPDPETVMEDEEKTFLMAATICSACGLFFLGAPLARFGSRALSTSYAGWTYVALTTIVILLLWVLAWRLGRNLREYRLLTLLIGLLGVLVFAVWTTLVAEPNYRMGEFFSYRCLNLSSGVAPNCPLLILDGAFLVWALVHLDRAGKIKARKSVASVKPETEAEALDGADAMQGVHDAIEKLFAKEIWIPAVLFVLIWLIVFVPWRTFRGFERTAYDNLYMALLLALYWAIAVTWMQFIWCWSRFKTFLQWLERQSGRNAYSRLRKEISLVPLVSRPREHQLYITSRSCDCLVALASFDAADLPGDHTVRLTKLNATLKPLIARIPKNLNGKLSQLTAVNDNSYAALQATLEAAAREIAADLRQWAWDEGESDCLRRILEEAPQRPPLTKLERLRIVEEEFIAYRYLIFIRYVLRHMRNLLGFIIWGFVLSVISMNCYPFQGHRWIGLANTIAFAALATGIGIVFAQIDRDAIMSRLTNTNANELGKTFFVRVVQYGALPVLTLLSSQFPSFNRAVFSWLQPALQALK
jgi:hypothetical protein